jgi:hypothetical protein
METQEPQCDSIDAEYEASTKAQQPGEFRVTATGTTERNCADCGTTLKAVNWDAEKEIPLTEFRDWQKLTASVKQAWIDALAKEQAEIEIEENGSDSDESGGGRYAKNIITSRVNFILTLKLNDPVLRLIYEGQVESQNAASEFEEQV